MTRVVWLDPSIENVNAGDEIIAEAIQVAGLTGLQEASRITTHRYLRKREIDVLRAADVVLVGGTNILRSNLWTSRQWPISPFQVRAMRRKTVFVGVGWWQYQKAVRPLTQRTLSYLSHPEIPHSARDTYTAERLRKVGLNCAMTSCPTLWDLHKVKPPATMGGRGTVVATVTDYYFDAAVDMRWLSMLSERFDEVRVVGMGPGDERVLKGLSAPSNVRWGGYGTAAIARARELADLHVGTRLHAGVRWLQLSGQSLVLAVDNRSREISRDTGLPVVGRADLDAIAAWLADSGTRTSDLRLPHEAIESWKSAWNAHVSNS